MATKFVSNLIAILALAAIFSFSQTTGQSSGECCMFKFWTYHVCIGLPNERPIKVAGDPSDIFWIRDNRMDESAQKCISLFCADGSDADDKYCGIGKCGANGCNCVGGCRKSVGIADVSLRMTWLRRHGLVREARHKF